MRALFVELPAIAATISTMTNSVPCSCPLRDPSAGDVIPDSGGLRKLRFRDARRGQGRRGGLRVIYFWWESGAQFWLFTLYGKGEVEDLSAAERRAVKVLIKAELEARRKP